MFTPNFFMKMYVIREKHRIHKFFTFGISSYLVIYYLQQIGIKTDLF
jgi:hypothetical protein